MTIPTKTINPKGKASDSGEYDGPEIGLNHFTADELAEIERECDAAEAEDVWLTNDEVFEPIEARQRARAKTCG